MVPRVLTTLVPGKYSTCSPSRGFDGGRGIGEYEGARLLGWSHREDLVEGAAGQQAQQLGLTEDRNAALLGVAELLRARLGAGEHDHRLAAHRAGDVGPEPLEQLVGLLAIVGREVAGERDLGAGQVLTGRDLGAVSHSLFPLVVSCLSFS